MFGPTRPEQSHKKREHYPLPTIEEVATGLHGTKFFPKPDVRNGFWHEALDDESSYVTTFNTPFGRYRWRRMPFGMREYIKSCSISIN